MNEIERLRKELDITQSELAEKVGYGDKSTICNIEKGKITIPGWVARKIAQVLGTSTRKLFKREKHKKWYGAKV